MPKVSICIPAYNNFVAFKRCFKSICKQTFVDYEIIITDDSTTEEIGDYIKATNDPKVRYIKNDKKLGSPENWNESLKYAQGEYVKIMHHDDWFTNTTSLELFVNSLDTNPGCDLAFVASKNVELQTWRLLSVNKPDHEFLKSLARNVNILICDNRIGAPSAVIFRNHPGRFFDRKLIWLVDIDFYLSILKNNANIAYSKDEAISIGISNTQITKSVLNNKEVNLFEYFYLLDKWQIRRLKDSCLFQTIKYLFRTFNVKKIQEIRSAGYTGKLPVDISEVLLSAKLQKIRAFLHSVINWIRN